MNPRRSLMLLAMALIATPVWAQGWTTADCAAILAAGHPRPVWGTSEKITQEGLLMMINYQLAYGACQQDEVLKALRSAPKTTAEPARGKLPDAPKPMKPDTVFPKPDSAAGPTASAAGKVSDKAPAAAPPPAMGPAAAPPASATPAPGAAASSTPAAASKAAGS